MYKEVGLGTKLTLVVVAFVLVIVNVVLSRGEFLNKNVNLINKEIDVVVQSERSGDWVLWTLHNSGSITRTVRFEAANVNTIVYNLKPRNTATVVSKYERGQEFTMTEIKADTDSVNCSNIGSTATLDGNKLYAEINNSSEYTVDVIAQIVFLKDDEAVECFYHECEGIKPFSTSELELTLVEKDYEVLIFSYPTILQNFE